MYFDRMSSGSTHFLDAILNSMLGKRLAECRKQQGWTQARLATELGGGYDQTMVSRVESGRADFQFSGLVRAAVVLNVSLDYLAGLTDVPDPVQKLTAVTASGFQVVAASQESDPHDRRFGGSPEPALGHLTFLHDRLVHHHIDPGKCSLIEVLDKAMEPTLEMGDLVLLDHSRTRRTQGWICAVRSGDRLLIRRLRRSGRNWHLGSDNPTYPDVAWPTDAAILGRAVWAGRIL